MYTMVWVAHFAFTSRNWRCMGCGGSWDLLDSRGYQKDNKGLQEVVMVYRTVLYAMGYDIPLMSKHGVVSRPHRGNCSVVA